MSQGENQLIPLEELGIVAPQEMPKELDVLTKSSDYLPQFRVYGSEAQVVKEGKFPMGHLGLYFSADNIVDMGVTTDCLVVAARPRASIVLGDQPVSFYKYDSKEFQDVKDKALAKVAGHLVGLEYLLWLPNFERFALFLMGNTTLRRESAKMKALLGKGATIKIKLIKATKYTWHGVDVVPCNTPFVMPEMEDIKTEYAKFNNPPESKAELAEDAGDSGRER